MCDNIKNSILFLFNVKIFNYFYTQFDEIKIFTISLNSLILKRNSTTFTMLNNCQNRHRRDSSIELFNYNNKQNNDKFMFNLKRRFAIFQN